MTRGARETSEDQAWTKERAVGTMVGLRRRSVSLADQRDPPGSLSFTGAVSRVNGRAGAGGAFVTV